MPLSDMNTMEGNIPILIFHSVQKLSSPAKLSGYILIRTILLFHTAEDRIS